MSERQNHYCTHCLKDFGRGHHCCDCVDDDHFVRPSTKSIDDIKNALLQYTLADVSDSFQHLTRTEREIIGDQETFDKLLKNIGGK